MIVFILWLITNLDTFLNIISIKNLISSSNIPSGQVKVSSVEIGLNKNFFVFVPKITFESIII